MKIKGIIRRHKSKIKLKTKIKYHSNVYKPIQTPSWSEFLLDQSESNEQLVFYNKKTTKHIEHSHRHIGTNLGKNDGTYRRIQKER